MGRTVALLDLDNTLVHCIKSTEVSQVIQKWKHLETHPYSFEEPDDHVIYVRPYVQVLLSCLKLNFDVLVCSLGDREYVEFVVKTLNIDARGVFAKDTFHGGPKALHHIKPSQFDWSKVDLFLQIDDNVAQFLEDRSCRRFIILGSYFNVFWGGSDETYLKELAQLVIPRVFSPIKTQYPSLMPSIDQMSQLVLLEPQDFLFHLIQPKEVSRISQLNVDCLADTFMIGNKPFKCYVHPGCHLLVEFLNSISSSTLVVVASVAHRDVLKAFISQLGLSNVLLVNRKEDTEIEQRMGVSFGSFHTIVQLDQNPQELQVLRAMEPRIILLGERFNIFAETCGTGVNLISETLLPYLLLSQQVPEDENKASEYIEIELQGQGLTSFLSQPHIQSRIMLTDTVYDNSKLTCVQVLLGFQEEFVIHASKADIDCHMKPLIRKRKLC